MNLNQQPILINGFLIVGLLLFPFQIKLSLLLLIVYLLASTKLNKPQLLSGRSAAFLMLLPISLYLLYTFSMVYTENISHGLKDLETKATILVIPLAILFFQRKNGEREVFSFWFIMAHAVTSVYLIVQSFLKWMQSGDYSSFFYDQFSVLMHPTYFTMCLSLAVMLLTETILNNNSPFSRYRLLTVTVLILLVISMYLTSSRAGLAIGWFIVAMHLLICFFQKRISLLYPSIFVIAAVLSVIFLSPADSRFKILLNEVNKAEVQTIGADSSRVDVSPVSHRLSLYRSAIQVAVEHPTGVGAGDVQDELVKVYREIGYQKAVDVRYNPHNQYLQTAVAIGWTGMLILMLFLFLLGVYALKNRDYVLASLPAIVGLNALFESVLEVQRGVLFLTITLLFLFVSYNKHR
jgi:O-antigen ligase